MTEPRLGLRANLAQFSLLVVVNAFVGAMVGMERSILSSIAEEEFHLVARTAVLSFIVVFGVTKALTNYVAGRLSDRIGRKKVLAGAAIGMAIVAIPCYYLIFSGNMGLAILGASIMAVVFAGHTGVIHIAIVELFPTRIRYSAYGLGYNVSSAIFGGTAPLLMTWLIADTGNVYMPAFYAVITAIGTLLAVLTIKDRSQEPLRDF